MSDLETKIKHSNICDTSLKKVENIVEKEQQTLQKKKNKNIKHFFEAKQVFQLLENLHVI